MVLKQCTTKKIKGEVEMSFLQAIRDFEFTVSGGFAWFFLICTGHVVISSVIQIAKFFIRWVNS